MPFSNVIGHDRILEVLLRMFKAGRLPHAVLFVGPQGVGKTTVAHILARELLGHGTGLAVHPDYATLDVLIDEKTGKRKSQVSVEQVRELTGMLALSPLLGGAKVAFLEEASALSIGAVNALLKTLEEPSRNVHIILRAGSVDELPATIVSRCQTFQFGIVPRGEIIECLKKMGYTPSDAQAAAVQSLGRPGRAIRFLNDSGYRASQAAGIDQAVSFFSASIPYRLGQTMGLIPKTETDKEDALASILDQWELVCRDVLLRHLGLSSLQAFSSKTLDHLAGATTTKSVISTFGALQEVRSAASYHINAHLALEHVALA